MSGHLLITGFGPFPGMPRNPAGALARRLGGSIRLRLALGGPPRVLVLPTTYAAIQAELAPALARKPAAVLMIGVASRAERMRVEARAQNRGSVLYPDAAGRPAARLSLDPRGPTVRKSPHAARALAIVRRHGLDVRASIDAGRYLCNAGYFFALAAGCPVLFVHIPPLPRTRRPGDGRRADVPARQAAALAAVAAALMVRARGAAAENRGAAVHKAVLARSVLGGCREIRARARL